VNISLWKIAILPHNIEIDMKYSKTNRII